MERVVETAAREMDIDRVELRRRNHIRPEQMPYRAPSGMLYDSGEFRTVMDKALIAGDRDGYAARQAASDGSIGQKRPVALRRGCDRQ